MWVTGLVGARWTVGLQSRFRWKSELVLRQAPQALQELGVNGVLVDQTILAGGSVAEHWGCLSSRSARR